MSDNRLTCPDCGHTFTEGEAAWTVCGTCGEVIPPGESFSDHGPGLRRGGEETARVWPCNQATRYYTEEEALAAQQEIRGE